MIRGSGLRSRRRQQEDVQPMQYVANLTDVMLVFACGLMAAVITFWQVDLNQVKTEVDPDKIQQVDPSEVIQESGNVPTEGLTNRGVVYEDPETGDWYIIKN